MIDLLSLDLTELTDFVKGIGESAFRAKQIRKWLLSGVDFHGMSNLPAALRMKLSEISVANSVTIIETLSSNIDETVKFLFRLADDNVIEGVLMRYRHGDTLCVSTQVGCNMGCKFCASTLEGCARSLTPGEMLGQVIAANSYAKSLDDTRRVHNVVLMGSGEPLDNYENVIKFLKILNDADGMNMSLRGVSLSTCGLVNQMYRLADEGLPITLSVSLHAPNDEIREKMMPVARKYKIDDIIAACRNYIEKTGRRVIFEYALVGGVNCDISHADELAGRLRGMQCHVNLIPLNEVRERRLAPPDMEIARRFLARLERNHISATIRREMGADIEGACGQLRRRRLGGSADEGIRA